jgi:hypothetical protein
MCLNINFVYSLLNIFTNNYTVSLVVFSHRDTNVGATLKRIPNEFGMSNTKHLNPDLWSGFGIFNLGTTSQY